MGLQVTEGQNHRSRFVGGLVLLSNIAMSYGGLPHLGQRGPVIFLLIAALPFLTQATNRRRHNRHVASTPMVANPHSGGIQATLSVGFPVHALLSSVVSLASLPTCRSPLFLILRGKLRNLAVWVLSLVVEDITHPHAPSA